MLFQRTSAKLKEKKDKFVKTFFSAALSVFPIRYKKYHLDVVAGYLIRHL